MKFTILAVIVGIIGFCIVGFNTNGATAFGVFLMFYANNLGQLK